MCNAFCWAKNHAREQHWKAKTLDYQSKLGVLYQRLIDQADHFPKEAVVNLPVSGPSQWDGVFSQIRLGMVWKCRNTPQHPAG